jgi:hypothetical protein
LLLAKSRTFKFKILYATTFLFPSYLPKLIFYDSSKAKSNRKGVTVMSKMIVQVLVIGIISALLVSSPAVAKTAKQPTAASEVKAKKAVPSETVKAVQEALDKEGYS